MSHIEFREIIFLESRFFENPDPQISSFGFKISDFSDIKILKSKNQKMCLRDLLAKLFLHSDELLECIPQRNLDVSHRISRNQFFGIAIFENPDPLIPSFGFKISDFSDFGHPKISKSQDDLFQSYCRIFYVFR